MDVRDVDGLLSHLVEINGRDFLKMFINSNIFFA